MKERRNKVMGIENIRGGEQLLNRNIFNFINRSTYSWTVPGMYAREEANRPITFIFYETNTKADWGSLGTVPCAQIWWDTFTGGGTAPLKGGGGHRLLSTSFFPCNAHRHNVKISLSKVATAPRCPPTPPHPTPRSAAHGYLNIPS